MSNIQTKIVEFSKKTFPKSNPASKFNHLLKEIEELRDCLQSWDNDPINFQMDLTKNEIADCMILLFDIAGYFDIDALDAVNTKYQINLNRTWGEPDEFGVVEHITECKTAE